MRTLLVLLLPSLLLGQEISLSAGRLHGIGYEGRTYSWQVGYAQQVSQDWALSLGWFNEGHLPGHHRDGGALMGWRILPTGSRVRVSLGAGLYRTFDTEDHGATYSNQHALKGIFAAVLQVPFKDSPWLTQVQLTRTVLSANQDTRSLMVGMGYSFRKADGKPLQVSVPRAPECQALTFYAGTAILNSQTSQTADGFALEYRRRLSLHFDWTLTYSDEGDLELISRDSLALQLWATREHLGGRLLLGFGVGPTFCHASPLKGQPTQTQTWNWGGRVTMGAAWRFQESPWQIRVAWNRTRASANRDTDLILAGLGFSY